MTTRTDWGWFKADGTPLAVGDAHHDWKCPRNHWEPSGYEHFVTGEWVQDDDRQVFDCKLKSTRPQRDECAACGNVFIYP